MLGSELQKPRRVKARERPLDLAKDHREPSRVRIRGEGDRRHRKRWSQPMGEDFCPQCDHSGFHLPSERSCCNTRLPEKKATGVKVLGNEENRSLKLPCSTQPTPYRPNIKASQSLGEKSKTEDTRGVECPVAERREEVCTAFCVPRS